MLALAVVAVDVKVGDDEDVIKMELELETKPDVGIPELDGEPEVIAAAATFALTPALAPALTPAFTPALTPALVLESALASALGLSSDSDESEELPPDIKEPIESNIERPKIFLLASFLVGTFSTAALAMAE